MASVHMTTNQRVPGHMGIPAKRRNIISSRCFILGIRYIMKTKSALYTQAKVLYLFRSIRCFTLYNVWETTPCRITAKFSKTKYFPLFYPFSYIMDLQSCIKMCYR